MTHVEAVLSHSTVVSSWWRKSGSFSKLLLPGRTEDDLGRCMSNTSASESRRKVIGTSIQKAWFTYTSLRPNEFGIDLSHPVTLEQIEVSLGG